MATVHVGPEWDPPEWGRGKEPGKGVLAAGSGADAVEAAAGKGGAAVIGRVPGAAALATELVRRGVHTMVYDVNTCKADEWGSLERAAARAGVRLRCGSHLARFVPVMAGVRAYAGGHVSISATVVGDPRAPEGRRGPRGTDVCALASDVAMAAFGEPPQAVFAAAPEDPHSYGTGGGGEPCDQVFEGAPEGHERGVADHTAIMMRFSGNRAALLSIDALPQDGCIVCPVPPDAANAGVEIYGHGGILRRASLMGGSISTSWILSGPAFGMRTGGPEGKSEDEEGDEHEEPGVGLSGHLPAMMAELETGEVPAWPPPDWLRKGVISEDCTSGMDRTPLDPPWLPARSTWKKGQPLPLPAPSSLAHVMEAILVSINTGAPVYLDQR